MKAVLPLGLCLAAALTLSGCLGSLELFPDWRTASVEVNGDFVLLTEKKKAFHGKSPMHRGASGQTSFYLYEHPENEDSLTELSLAMRDLMITDTGRYDLADNSLGHSIEFSHSSRACQIDSVVEGHLHVTQLDEETREFAATFRIVLVGRGANLGFGHCDDTTRMTLSAGNLRLRWARGL